MDKEKWKLKFSEALYSKMQELNLSVSDLEKRSGVEQHSIYRYLERRHIPTSYNIARLADALNCTTDELISFAKLYNAEDRYGD